MNSTKSLELTVRTQNKVQDLVERASTRMQQQRGQTAAEYLGVLVVIAVLIGILAGSGIGDKLLETIKGAIDKVAAGKGNV